jgi:hypothetical protein
MADTEVARRSGRAEGCPAVRAATERGAQRSDPREFARPPAAPAYYLGRPASVWLARFRPDLRISSEEGEMPESIPGRRQCV